MAWVGFAPSSRLPSVARTAKAARIARRNAIFRPPTVCASSFAKFGTSSVGLGLYWLAVPPWLGSGLAGCGPGHPPGGESPGPVSGLARICGHSAFTPRVKWVVLARLPARRPPGCGALPGRVRAFPLILLSRDASGPSSATEHPYRFYVAVRRRSPADDWPSFHLVSGCLSASLPDGKGRVPFSRTGSVPVGHGTRLNRSPAKNGCALAAANAEVSQSLLHPARRRPKPRTRPTRACRVKSSERYRRCHLGSMLLLRPGYTPGCAKTRPKPAPPGDRLRLW
jgi:hypothetical protein